MSAEPSSQPTEVSTPAASMAVPAAGDWTRIDWRKVASPGMPVPVKRDEVQPTVNLFGWSHGYVAFTWTFSSLQIVPWSSSDGLTWTAGPKLDMHDFTAGLKEWQQGIAADFPDSEASCDLHVDNFAEGPGSILATGWLTCSAGCGVYWIGPEMWASDDGSSWHRVAPISELPRISGGSSGFVAITGMSSVAISQDGRTWRKAAEVPLPAGASSVALDSAAAFYGGFVLAGSIAYGHACAYALEGNRVEAGIWWSADGSSWTRDELSPSLTCADADVRLSRLSDRALLARESCYPNSTVVGLAWTSTDGRSWTPLNYADSISEYAFYTDGTANLGYSYKWGSGGYSESIGQFCYFDNRLLPVALAQSGDVPAGQLQLALGPAGVIATVDGTQFWMGIPG